MLLPFQGASSRGFIHPGRCRVLLVFQAVPCGRNAFFKYVVIIFGRFETIWQISARRVLLKSSYFTKNRRFQRFFHFVQGTSPCYLGDNEIYLGDNLNYLGHNEFYLGTFKF